MDWRSDGGWEALALILILTKAENHIAQTRFFRGSRIAPKSNRSFAAPKQPAAIRRVPISGDALARPVQQPSRSSESFRNVADLQPSELCKPEFTFKA